jgi:hypothetical protein
VISRLKFLLAPLVALGCRAQADPKAVNPNACLYSGDVGKPEWKPCPQEDDWAPVCPQGHDKSDVIGDDPTYRCYECGAIFQKPGRLREKEQ